MRVLEHICAEQLPVKVVVITGTSDAALLRRAELQGPDVVMRWPLDFLSVLNKISPPA
jgi:hypothetical protein